FEQKAWPVLLLGVITIGLTSFYMFRLYFLAFHGKPRGDQHIHDHAHDAPLPMKAALIPLALFSIVAGAANWPKGLGGQEWFNHFLEPVLGGHGTEHLAEPAMSRAGEMLFSTALAVPALLGF